MKKIYTFLLVFFVSFFLQACNSKKIKSISKIDSTELYDTYLIKYDDGKDDKINVKNDIKNKELGIDDLYSLYLSNNPNSNYDEFINQYIKSFNDYSYASIKGIKSSLKIYTEFIVDYKINSFIHVNDKALQSGSAVIYKIEDDYTYVITNYHCIYNNNAHNKITSKITGYLYGSEDNPKTSNKKDDMGYMVYNYGNYAIEMEYVNGSIDYDLALLKCKTSDLININTDIKPITFNTNYNVGSSCIAIGNSKDLGISVTSGIISIKNEYVNLMIDDNVRSYRLIRTDTPIYEGNSGGGLFDCYGNLIGITNAGDINNKNINYSIPALTVKNVIDNIYKNNELKILNLDLKYTEINKRYVYNNEIMINMGDIIISDVNDNSIIDKLGLKINDQIISIYINEKKHDINNGFDLNDLLISVYEGDLIKLGYIRGNNEFTSNCYKVLKNDLK